MNVVLIPILQAIAGVLFSYQVIILVSIVLSWLYVLGIVDADKFPTLGRILLISRLVTEPVYQQVRRIIPPLGMMDFSPVVVMLVIHILIDVINRTIIKLSVVF